MAEDGRKDTLGIVARKRESVGVADTRGLDFDQHLAGARAVEVNGFYGERCSGLVGYGGFDFHGFSLVVDDSLGNCCV
jgi:hypothetical protein